MLELTDLQPLFASLHNLIQVFYIGIEQKLIEMEDSNQVWRTKIDRLITQLAEKQNISLVVNSTSQTLEASPEGEEGSLVSAEGSELNSIRNGNASSHISDGLMENGVGEVTTCVSCTTAHSKIITDTIDDVEGELNPRRDTDSGGLGGSACMSEENGASVEDSETIGSSVQGDMSSLVSAVDSRGSTVPTKRPRGRPRSIHKRGRGRPRVKPRPDDLPNGHHTPPKTSFSCSECGQTYPSHAQLINHQFEHMQASPYNCVECPRSFTRLRDLQLHSRYHSGGYPYECEVCGRAYSSKTLLQSHQRFHLKAKFKCRLCKKRFLSATSRDKHFRIHVSAQNTIKSQDRNVFQDTIKQEGNSAVAPVHGEEEIYPCAGCTKVFRHRSSLKRHSFLHETPTDSPSVPTYFNSRLTRRSIDGSELLI